MTGPDNDPVDGQPRKLFGREPALWLAGINAVVMVVGTFGFAWFDIAQAGLFVAVLNALFAVWQAVLVRPVAPGVFTYAIAAVLALAGSYGFGLTDQQVAMVNASVVPLLTLIFRGQVSPKETAVSKA